MEFVLHPWHVLLLTVSGWINREQEQIIEYLLAENQVLRKSSARAGSFLMTINGDGLQSRVSH